MNATTAKTQTPPAHVGMFQLLNGVFVVGAISCLARLGIPDLVEHGSKSADELATAIGADPRALYRLMRATACVGVLSEGTDGKFSETPLSAVLCSNANPSLRTFAIMHGRDWHGLGWSHLDYCVRTGKQALDKIYGMPIFKFFEQHPEEGQLFQQSMSDLSMIDGPAVAEAYSFGEIQSIVDVGGGHGLLLATILASEECAYEWHALRYAACRGGRQGRTAQAGDGTLHGRVRGYVFFGSRGRRCVHHEAHHS
jgi:O-methyltransferase domain